MYCMQLLERPYMCNIASHDILQTSMKQTLHNASLTGTTKFASPHKSTALRKYMIASGPGLLYAISMHLRVVASRYSQALQKQTLSSVKIE